MVRLTQKRPVFLLGKEMDFLGGSALGAIASYSFPGGSASGLTINIIEITSCLSAYKILHAFAVLNDLSISSA
jgi:hypothetical protein